MIIIKNQKNGIDIQMKSFVNGVSIFLQHVMKNENEKKKYFRNYDDLPFAKDY